MKRYLSLSILLLSLPCFAKDQIKIETKQEYNLVWSVTTEKNGNIWYSTSNGIVQITENKIKDFTIHNSGLISNQVRAIALDRDGSKWIATNKGVSHWDDSTWRSYTKIDGLISNNISCVAIDKNGHKWFGTDQGLTIYDNKSWQSYTRLQGLIDNYITTIGFDSYGNCWVGTSMGISNYDGVHWRSITFLDQPNDNLIKSFQMDSIGNLWFQTSHGIRKFDGINWTYFPCNDKLKNCIVGTLKDPLWTIVDKIKKSSFNAFDLEVQKLIQETISGNSKLIDINQLMTYPNQNSKLLYLNKLKNGLLIEILTAEGPFFYMKNISEGNSNFNITEGFYTHDLIYDGSNEVFVQKIYLH